jgi:hypothetical protein
MAQQVKVSWLDDVDGSAAAETVGFELDGRAYEIDLSEQNAARLRALLAEFAAAGRRVGGRAGRAAQPPRPAGSERTPVIRAWAQAQGYTVPARGRLAGDVVRAYEERQSAPAEAPVAAQAPVVSTASEDAPQGARSRVSPPVFSGL